jgi:hypothetical protein
VHEYVSSLLGDTESHGGSAVFASRFLPARAHRSTLTAIVESGGDATKSAAAGSLAIGNHIAQHLTDTAAHD